VASSRASHGQPFPSRGSRDKPAQNADGSTDFYLGPKAPTGKEGNWLATVPGRGYFAIVRLYGPTKPALNKSWKPGDIEKVNCLALPAAPSRQANQQRESEPLCERARCIDARNARNSSEVRGYPFQAPEPDDTAGGVNTAIEVPLDKALKLKKLMYLSKLSIPVGTTFALRWLVASLYVTLIF
jgi:hypothetical protein